LKSEHKTHTDAFHNEEHHDFNRGTHDH